MDEEAFKALLDAYKVEQNIADIPVGRSPHKWSLKARGRGYSGTLGEYDRQVSRADLRDICKGEVSVADSVAAICAWGGMRVTHGRALFEALTKWTGVVAKMRHAKLTRQSAYQLLMEARAGGCLPGMGPAYFTKLIFFLRPELGGYIMDQWTARSINLIFGPALSLTHGGVRLNHVGNGRYVSDANSPAIYQQFCERIECLSRSLAQAIGQPVPPEDTEILIFSRGGRAPGLWRGYLKIRG